MVGGALILCLFLSSESSPIRDDEVVVFFPSLARRAPAGEGPGWILDIHGWIYEPEQDSVFRAGLLEGLGAALGLEKGDAQTATFKERARWFIVDNERGKKVSILLGGKRYPLDASLPNGHFRGTLRLGEEELRVLKQGRQGGVGPIRFRAVTRDGDDRVFAGEIHVVEGEGLSVISDIDDTVKISETRDRKALLANTFLLPYRAVPGMADFYRDLEREGAAFHYVSASPWQLYGPLSEFLAASGFPGGTFALKDFRLKDSTFRKLFENPFEYKVSAIEKILDAVPSRRFVLIGDSTEKDPEVYGELARRYPERIEGILIREVEGSPMDEDRTRSAFDGVPSSKRKIFREPGELRPRKERSL